MGKAMTDFVDYAQEMEEEHRAKSINKKLKEQETIFSEKGETECIDCGVIIPEARLQAFPSAKRCIDCQTFSEKKGF